MLLLFFLFGLSVWNQAGAVFLLLLVCAAALWGMGPPFSRSEILLLFFSLSYFGMDVYHHGLTLRGCVVYLLGPWSAYRMGKSYVLYAGSRQALGRVLAAPALGMGLHGLLNWLACLPHQAGGAPVRLAVDVWRGDPVSVTCTGMLLTAVSALALGALAAPGSRRRKGAAVCCLGACLAESVYFANRTLPAICLLLLAGRALAWLFRPDVAPERKLRRCAGVFLCALPVTALLVWDVWGFGDWFVSLPLLERIRNPEAGISRVKIWLSFFQNGRWLRFPLGGEELTAGLPVSWFHNLWLDLYRQGGLLPFVLFLVFTVLEIRHALALRRNMSSACQATGRVVTAYLLPALFLNAMVEPVMDANVYWFLCTLLFLGAVRGWGLRDGREVPGFDSDVDHQLPYASYPFSGGGAIRPAGRRISLD